MLVIGLTGSMGMGKSAAAAHFAARGVKVFDADACVHRLYAGEAVAAIEAAFPGVAPQGHVDRRLLAEQVAGSPARLRQLEQIIHPLVVKAEIDFLRAEEAKGAKLAVLEIPLLFETDAQERVDVSIVVSAPEAMQRERVLARPGMTKEKFAGLQARQMPDAEKRARAAFIVDSGTGLEDMQAEIDKLIESLLDREGTVMQRLRHWKPG
ncbi:MAG: dephospho-CoA kinase [Methyloceanibacter sp.]|uniref:dephospho-CoA kinase n=1 Tax=Methyloceanibacter sp. TaxID=1965321 RepID=UPI003D9B262C